MAANGAKSNCNLGSKTNNTHKPTKSDAKTTTKCYHARTDPRDDESMGPTLNRSNLDCRMAANGAKSYCDLGSKTNNTHKPTKRDAKTTTKCYHARTDPNGMCPLIAPCRPSMQFLSISSQFSHSLPSPDRLPFPSWPLIVVCSFSCSGIPTGDLNPIYNVPMLGTHKPAHPTAGNVLL